MNNYKYVKISSRWTNLSYVGGFIGIVILPLIGTSFMLLSEGELKWVLFFLFTIALTVLTIYCLIYLAKIEIIENEFHIKKLFKAKQIYHIGTLSKLRVIPMKTEDYIILTLTKDGKKENALVYANKFFLYANENRQTEKVLREIITENKKTK